MCHEELRRCVPHRYIANGKSRPRLLHSPFTINHCYLSDSLHDEGAPVNHILLKGSLCTSAVPPGESVPVAVCLSPCSSTVCWGVFLWPLAAALTPSPCCPHRRLCGAAEGRDDGEAGHRVQPAVSHDGLHRHADRHGRGPVRQQHHPLDLRRHRRHVPLRGPGRHGTAAGAGLGGVLTGNLALLCCCTSACCSGLFSTEISSSWVQFWKVQADLLLWAAGNELVWWVAFKKITWWENAAASRTHRCIILSLCTA